jgi:hypothetical protein
LAAQGFPLLGRHRRGCSRCGPESLEQPSLCASQAPRTSEFGVDGSGAGGIDFLDDVASCDEAAEAEAAGDAGGGVGDEGFAGIDEAVVVQVGVEADEDEKRPPNGFGGRLPHTGRHT